MVLGEADPLVLPLEKAEIAAGSTAPPVVLGNTYCVLQDSKYIGLDDAILDEWIRRLDIRLVADVALPVLIGADADVAHAGIVADEGFEGFELHDARTPSGMWCGQEVVEALQVVVKVASAAQSFDGLAR